MQGLATAIVVVGNIVTSLAISNMAIKRAELRYEKLRVASVPEKSISKQEDITKDPLFWIT